MFEKAKKWFKEHKKEIVFTTIGVTIGGAAIAGVTVLAVSHNKKQAKELNWLHSLSDDELAMHRENERLAWVNCYMKFDYETANKHESRMNWFDRETDRRFHERHPNYEWHGPVHREHGLYLPNDD